MSLAYEEEVLYGGKYRVRKARKRQRDQPNYWLVNPKMRSQTPIPSATEVCGLLDKPGLIYWAVEQTLLGMEEALPKGTTIDTLTMERAKKSARGHRFRTSGDAKLIGTLVHEWLERWAIAKMRGEVEPALPTNEEILGPVQQFLGWAADRQVEIIASERRMASVEHAVGGTVDKMGVMLRRNIPFIGDYKTSKSVRAAKGPNAGEVYAEIRMQLAIYRAAAVEEGFFEEYDEPPHRLVFWLPKDGSTCEVIDLEEECDYETDLAAFLGLRQTFRALRGY